MSGTWEALMHMMRSRVSFFEDSTPASAQSPAKGWGVSKQPSEAANSYFPERTPSPASSVSEAEDDGPTPVTKANRMIGAEYPIPPLEREYSRPTEELDVAQQLAKKPLPRSLHSSLQRAASRTAQRPVDDEETRRQKLAAAKKEILALAGQV
ncbi:hypothetical protein F4813DRAFT_353290 [Daldinia decipiens]|uniref:uncharacterized protein n=1 Tax=Daldinia decipiens TaxID=326647 RepID=UPI0020C230FE|nr:uncharacterized protein F4813DRAFT_353290 [Daldinia decipiens]KAI1659549.1 hypothetical protein F4813DRAFT_353290 [Daldinia decipiens]